MSKPFHLTLLYIEDDAKLTAPSMMSLDLPNLLGPSGAPDIPTWDLWYFSTHMGNVLYRKRGVFVTLHTLPELEQDTEAFIHRLQSICHKSFRPQCRNVMYFGGHCYVHHLRPLHQGGYIPLTPWVDYLKHHGLRYDVLLFDCCYMSSLSGACLYASIADYLVGAESSVHLGYLGPGFLSCFHPTRSTRQTTIHLAEQYLARNNTMDRAWRHLVHDTDAVVLELKHAHALYHHIRRIPMYRRKSSRVEPTYSDTYDLWHLVHTQPIPWTKDDYRMFRQLFRQFVIYYNQSRKMKTNSHAHRLHGLSIVLHRPFQYGPSLTHNRLPKNE